MPDRRTPLGRGKPPVRREPPEDGARAPIIHRGKPPQRRGRIRQVSAKRADESEDRARVRAETFARAGNLCEARHVVPEVRCGTIGDRAPLECDEKVSRGVYPGAHLDVTVTQALCPMHHDWKGDNPAEAKRRGLRLSSWDNL